MLIENGQAHERVPSANYAAAACSQWAQSASLPAGGRYYCI